MIKFNVKSLILAFCVLGGMVTAGVASAIPIHYSLSGKASGVTGVFSRYESFSDLPFLIELTFDPDHLNDPSLFDAFIQIELPVGAMENFGEFNNRFFGYLPFEYHFDFYPRGFDLYTQADHDWLRMSVDHKNNQSNVEFKLGIELGTRGTGSIDKIKRIALPTPSSAFLMLPLLLFVFRRSLLNMFNTFKPVRALAA